MPTGHSPDVMRWVILSLSLSHKSLYNILFFWLDLWHITSFYTFYRWLDPQKLVRKQVRRNSSHNSSSSNSKELSGSTHHQNGHAQKTSTGSGSSTNNVIILYFRVKFYVTGNHIIIIIIHNNYYDMPNTIHFWYSKIQKSDCIKVILKSFDYGVKNIFGT